VRSSISRLVVFVGSAALIAGGTQTSALAVDLAPVVVNTVTVGAGPWGVAITPDSRRAFIGNSGLAGGGNNVSVIDLESGNVIRNVSTRLGGAAGVAITPNGEFAFVANFALDGTVSRIGAGTYSVTESGIVNTDALAIAASPDNQSVYVVCQFGQVWRVDVNNVNIRTSLETPNDGTFDIAVNATQQVYVGGNSTGKVRIVGDSGRVGTLTSIGTAVALSPDGNTAYVGDTGGRFYIFDLTAINWNTAIATYSLGGDIRGIAVTPDGRQAYVTDRNGNTVRVVDLSNGEILYTIPVGLAPQRVAISANGLTAVVTNNSAGTVSIIAIPQAESPSNGAGAVLYESLSLAQVDGVDCRVRSVRGARGTWVELPSMSECTVTDSLGSQLLGWATSADFSVEIARRQVVNGWGAYETFYPDGRLSGVFIPAGGFAHLINSIPMYPIIGKL
jgi:YVTN family beta-propeller protein